MKKSLAILSLSTIFFGAIQFSCKKDKKEFVATDMTGTSVVAGRLTKTVGGNTTPLQGGVVTIKVNNNDLYPNSNAQGSEVYTATSDANGYYAVGVKTNGNGVQGQLTFRDRCKTQVNFFNSLLLQKSIDFRRSFYIFWINFLV